MQTRFQERQRWFMLGLLMLTLTACSTTVSQAPPDTASGRGNDTNARVTAEAMIKDALEGPWVQRFAQVAGRKPAVTVGTVSDRTQARLNTQTFIEELERALMQSKQVQFVASTPQRQQESGADFMLQGTIQVLGGQSDSTKAVVYQVDLELVDVASNVQVWRRQKQATKLVEPGKTTL